MRRSGFGSNLSLHYSRIVLTTENLADRTTSDSILAWNNFVWTSAISL